jgi:hypothetical protein
MDFYKDKSRLRQMMGIINGESKISLRIVDWFVTNYAKMKYTIYELTSNRDGDNSVQRFKVYNDYKLKLKAYSKRRFDPFCRWERISIPYEENTCMETTIGQLNFFKWAIENGIIDYITENYDDIEQDMNSRNSISKKKNSPSNRDDDSEMTNITLINDKNGKTRKKREELSISACKCIKKENVKIIVSFN